MLATHRLLFRVALTAGNVFAWVIVFRMFLLATRDLEVALAGTAALYVLSHAVTFVLTPLSGMALRRGVKEALMAGTACAAVSFALIALVFLADPTRDEIFWTVTAFAIAHGVYRALYFVPYKAAEGTLTSPTSLAREAAIALIPAAAGYLLAEVSNGPFILFSSAAAIMLLSLFSVVRMRETYESFDWTYGTTLRELVARKNHLAVGLFILDGIQGAVLLFVWPLAIFVLLGSFKTLGAILTATLCVAFLGRFLVKKFLRALRISSPVVIASIVFSGWIIKLAAATPVHVLAANIYYTSGTSPARFSLDTAAHEQSADGGHFIDEYTVIKEMGLAIGRIALGVLFIILLQTTAEAVAFAAAIVTAAIAAAWSVFLAHRLQKAVY